MVSAIERGRKMTFGRGTCGGAGNFTMKQSGGRQRLACARYAEIASLAHECWRFDDHTVMLGGQNEETPGG
jgi:hypothetical protein